VGDASAWQVMPKPVYTGSALYVGVCMSALCRDTEWLEEQIAAVKTQIIATRSAITSAVTGGVDMYQLDTGQTRTYVQKNRLPALRQLLQELQNELAVLQVKLCGGSIVGVPDF
jgi:hypothetical protein